MDTHILVSNCGIFIRGKKKYAGKWKSAFRTEEVGSRSRRAYFSTAIVIIAVVYQHFSAF